MAYTSLHPNICQDISTTTPFTSTLKVSREQNLFFFCSNPWINLSVNILNAVKLVLFYFAMIYFHTNLRLLFLEKNNRFKGCQAKSLVRELA